MYVPESELQADASLENEPGFLFDALVLPDGASAVQALAADGHTLETVRDQYRHCKTLLVLGASRTLLKMAGIATEGEDAGLIVADTSKLDGALQAFLAGVAQHRHFARASDPPRV